MVEKTQKLEFDGHSGARLAARLDLPNGPVRGYALLVHCFTCSKDLVGLRRIGSELARAGIAVLRFDFTGLGSSEGEFASTNFSTNIQDIYSAVDFMRSNLEAPALMIGHSLGGAAVLAAAGKVEEVQAVVTLGAPSDADHVLENFHADIGEIERSGKARVDLHGRHFTIERQFLDDVREHKLADAIKDLRKPLLIMHAPGDEIVGIDSATAIFTAARHPKSFVSLDKADHLLTDEADARFAASVIAGWASRYLAPDHSQAEEPIEHVRVSETGVGQFQNAVQAGRHRLFADEPEEMGGDDTGPSPYDFLSAALGACTSMTLRIYAQHKKIDLGRVSVDVSHRKVHRKDSGSDISNGKSGRIDQFDRLISVEGELDEALRAKVVEIANKCPVHRTLENSSHVLTRLVDEDEE
ncbi:bifunctional alpha/beta hydrolase/OsmC family protein [Nitratireductor basaltis]|uniref:Putative OsmC family protein n=1 Tax=Nitratireductor basaltis TaxID=472175 RepID=A0A084UCE6_9HYPH|nr:bifunctional alpha/beta hydrolase/OsmC family protein [Nitratireductor basaltis]KFB10632.1 putative OsmC family protein [Nitratireductor basaltis]